MSRIVQKYGGTSVGTSERIRAVAQRVARCRNEGNEVVVVVSAMSGVTNSLIQLAKEVSDSPTDREMDVLLATGEQTTIALLAMALHQLGVPALSFTGAQAGIVTDGVHTRAKIANISPAEINTALDRGNVVIVAGFQGRSKAGQITTLGRGGSDLSAIALAAATKADVCQIYTDVDGVYTADPRLVKNARKIEEISYEEMLEMASSGSKVMQSRAVEFAKKFGVLFEVRSSFNDNSGTIVKEEEPSMENVVVRGVSIEKNQAKVTIASVPDKPGVAAKLFQSIADAGVNVDMIVQNVSHATHEDGELATDITFTLSRDDLSRVEPILDDFKQEAIEAQLIVKEGIAKLSVVGIGMKSHSGVASKLFSALADAGINIQMISTSEIKISIVVDEDQANDAMNQAHESFELHLEEPKS
ncbi:MAG: aspartate kinase [Verrucomicrobiota bacterium]